MKDSPTAITRVIPLNLVQEVHVISFVLLIKRWGSFVPLHHCTGSQCIVEGPFLWTDMTKNITCMQTRLKWYQFSRYISRLKLLVEDLAEFIDLKYPKRTLNVTKRTSISVL